MHNIVDVAAKMLKRVYNTDFKSADACQLNQALAYAVMEKISPAWNETRDKRNNSRRAYYFSAEYLPGQQVFNNLQAIGSLYDVKRELDACGANLTALSLLPDPAIGNGGLGRLAACYLDSAATLDVPLDGYGLRYKYGMFRQGIDNGRQVEHADEWLKSGDSWSVCRSDLAVTVEFCGERVMAVPYDMPVIGYKSGVVSTLRLWQAEAYGEELNLARFDCGRYDDAVKSKNDAENITRVLYPNDNTVQGLELRIKQQYLLCSASLKDILRRYNKTFGHDYSRFSRMCIMQLNDTHPTVAIPELIRLLTEDGVAFDMAFDIAQGVFAYTNHTLMREALETWDEGLYRRILPHVFDIIVKINNRQTTEFRDRRISEHQIANMRILRDGRIHMANLATYMSTRVNGVAAMHTDLLKTKVLSDWNSAYPEKFVNITNGITPRRYLALANPELTGLIRGALGNDGFLTDLSKLCALEKVINDDLAVKFIRVKSAKKVQLAEYVRVREGMKLPSDFVIDSQIKRLHEYKRQLMNALAVMDMYFSVKDGTLHDFPKTLFLFGGKAASAYVQAKRVIEYILLVADIINNDSAVNDVMRVVFVENYDCSYAERIIPATDISEQISTAGMEASGTGNMKFMLNGAVTLGTLDGANVEIVSAAGKQNNYIFGATEAELFALRDTYRPIELYERQPRIHRVLDTMLGNCGAKCESMRQLFASLVNNPNWRSDAYYVLYDLLPYIDAKVRAIYDTRDEVAFAKKCLMNIAHAGEFSSDRAVADYAKSIWHV